MRLVLSDSEYEVDVKATKSLYSKALFAYQKCTCPCCRNFDDRVSKADKSDLAFFLDLGINPSKPQNIWAYLPGEEPGTQRYLCEYPMICTPSRHNEEWCAVKDGLLAAVVQTDTAFVLKVDWSLRWARV